jgi:hypothetical protein
MIEASREPILHDQLVTSTQTVCVSLDHGSLEVKLQAAGHNRRVDPLRMLLLCQVERESGRFGASGRALGSASGNMRTLRCSSWPAATAECARSRSRRNSSSSRRASASLSATPARSSTAVSRNATASACVCLTRVARSSRTTARGVLPLPRDRRPRAVRRRTASVLCRSPPNLQLRLSRFNSRSPPQRHANAGSAIASELPAAPAQAALVAGGGAPAGLG